MQIDPAQACADSHQCKAGQSGQSGHSGQAGQAGRSGQAGQACADGYLDENDHLCDIVYTRRCQIESLGLRY